MAAPPQANLAAVVVLYFPPQEVYEQISRLAEMCHWVLVVDNTPGALDPTMIELAGRSPEIAYLPQGRNAGISVALNTGVREALVREAEWVLLLDQDSVVPDAYLSRLQETLQAYPEASRIGVICPTLGEIDQGHRAWQIVPLAITSGSLIRTCLFETCGWFNEDLFIDYVDFDYCLRLRAVGWLVLMATQARLEHRIGDPISLPTPFGRIRTLNHPPIRRYYKFRNRIHMLKTYLFRHPAWMIKELLSGALEVAKSMLVEPSKAAKLAMILRGTLDALRGRTGAAPSGLDVARVGR